MAMPSQFPRGDGWRRNQSVIAHIQDPRQIGHRMQRLFQRFSDRPGGAGEEVFRLVDVETGKGCRTTERMGAVGIAVKQFDAAGAGLDNAIVDRARATDQRPPN